MRPSDQLFPELGWCPWIQSANQTTNGFLDSGVLSHVLLPLSKNAFFIAHGRLAAQGKNQSTTFCRHFLSGCDKTDSHDKRTGHPVVTLARIQISKISQYIWHSRRQTRLLLSYDSNWRLFENNLGATFQSNFLHSLLSRRHLPRMYFLRWHNYPAFQCGNVFRTSLCPAIFGNHSSKHFGAVFGSCNEILTLCSICWKSHGTAHFQQATGLFHYHPLER